MAQSKAKFRIVYTPLDEFKYQLQAYTGQGGWEIISRSDFRKTLEQEIQGIIQKNSKVVAEYEG